MLMAEDALYPIAEAEQLVQDFLDLKLKKGEFTHEAHLLTGLYMLSRHGEETLALLRKKLADYLVSIGVESGYHETMTRFWLRVLREEFTDENGVVHWNQANVDHVIDSEVLTERNLWLEHYTKETMMSDAARSKFVEPDLKPF